MRFFESYIVSLDYRKPDGYWVSSHKEDVSLEYSESTRKNNHSKAEAIAMQRYPGCRINSVTYC